MKRAPTIDLSDFRTPWELHGDFYTAEWLVGAFLRLWPGEQIIAWSKPDD
jgi:hypothetical protein